MKSGSHWLAYAALATLAYGGGNTLLWKLTEASKSKGGTIVRGLGVTTGVVAYEALIWCAACAGAVGIGKLGGAKMWEYIRSTAHLQVGCATTALAGQSLLASALENAENEGFNPGIANSLYNGEAILHALASTLFLGQPLTLRHGVALVVAIAAIYVAASEKPDHAHTEQTHEQTEQSHARAEQQSEQQSEQTQGGGSWIAEGIGAGILYALLFFWFDILVGKARAFGALAVLPAMAWLVPTAFLGVIATRLFGGQGSLGDAGVFGVNAGRTALSGLLYLIADAGTGIAYATAPNGGLVDAVTNADTVVVTVASALVYGSPLSARTMIAIGVLAVSLGSLAI